MNIKEYTYASLCSFCFPASGAHQLGSKSTSLFGEEIALVIIVEVLQKRQQGMVLYPFRYSLAKIVFGIHTRNFEFEVVRIQCYQIWEPCLHLLWMLVPRVIRAKCSTLVPFWRGSALNVLHGLSSYIMFHFLDLSASGRKWLGNWCMACLPGWRHGSPALTKFILEPQ